MRSFGLFKDTSELVFGGVPISLNVQCMKPTGAPSADRGSAPGR
jgi:hypothetical protein